MMLKFDSEDGQTLFFGAVHFGEPNGAGRGTYRVFPPDHADSAPVDVSGQLTEGWESETVDGTPYESDSVTVHDWRVDP